MRVIRAPQECNKTADIFLGGSTIPYDWRGHIMARLSDIDGLIFNPERTDFPEEGTAEYRKQIIWERSHLENSRIAVFWLSNEKPTSYASRVEVGLCAGLSIPIVIGIEDGFYGKKYLEAFLEMKPVQTLEELAMAIRRRLI